MSLSRSGCRCSRRYEDESADWERPRRWTDVTACVRGRIEFVEKPSADAIHKKFSDKVPESRAKKRNGRAFE